MYISLLLPTWLSHRARLLPPGSLLVWLPSKNGLLFFVLPDWSFTHLQRLNLAPYECFPETSMPTVVTPSWRSLYCLMVFCVVCRLSSRAFRYCLAFFLHCHAPSVGWGAGVYARAHAGLHICKPKTDSVALYIVGWDSSPLNSELDDWLCWLAGLHIYWGSAVCCHNVLVKDIYVGAGDANWYLRRRYFTNWPSPRHFPICHFWWLACC